MAIALYGRRAELYDAIYSDKEYEREAARLVRLATRRLGRRPRSLLDVACGTGRHLVAFRRTIPRVEGVDRSAAMLRIARRRLGPRVPLTRADMRRFRLPRRFDVVVCLFSGIGYLIGARARAEALARWFAHLDPGGVALIEGWVLPTTWKDGHVALQTYRGPDATIARLSTPVRRGRITTLRMEYLLHRPGHGVERFREEHRMELVPEREILAALRATGFRARAEPFDASGSRALYVAVRPREPRGRTGGRAPGSEGGRGGPRARSKAF